MGMTDTREQAFQVRGSAPRSFLLRVLALAWLIFLVGPTLLFARSIVDSYPFGLHVAFEDWLVSIHPAMCPQVR